MLRYASLLTEAPAFVSVDDIGALRDAGWSERGAWEISALASFFNFTGRLEAASGLPPDRVPEGAAFAEAGSG